MDNHNITHQPSIRSAFIALFALLPVVFFAACSSDSGSDGPAATSQIASEQSSGFATEAELIEFLQTMQRSEDMVALANTLWSRNDLESALARLTTNLVRLQHEYIALLREKFEIETQMLPPDLGAAALARAISDVRIEEISPTRRLLRFNDEAGQERRLVLVELAGRWHLHALSLSNNEAIDGVWYQPRYSRIRLASRRCEELLQKMRAGEIDNAEGAESQMQRIIGNRPPLTGGLRALTITVPFIDES